MEAMQNEQKEQDRCRFGQHDYIQPCGRKETPHEVLMKVYYSMREKGYDPVSQIVGYLISGDPTYITSYNNARYLIRMFERDELIEELVRTYVEQYNGDDTL